MLSLLSEFCENKKKACSTRSVKTLVRSFLVRKKKKQEEEEEEEEKDDEEEERETREEKRDAAHTQT
jgi:ABC-type Zn2+ transport system substrate-binding protein/surface adhesin